MAQVWGKSKGGDDLRSLILDFGLKTNNQKAKSSISDCGMRPALVRPVGVY